MNTPGFAAEASLYRSGKVYSGHGGFGGTTPSVVAASACTDACSATYQSCLRGCAGGGGGGSTCCPTGKRCCGPCVKIGGRSYCEDGCVGPHQECP